MTEQKTTMLDIYEAAGFELSEDRQSVKMEGGQLAKPFDIVLRVVPETYEMVAGLPVKIGFRVLLKQSVNINGGTVTFTEHDVLVKLPVDQVRILKKEQVDG